MPCLFSSRDVLGSGWPGSLPAQREVAAAKSALAFLPESEYKQVLLGLADYALAREV